MVVPIVWAEEIIMGKRKSILKRGKLIPLGLGIVLMVSLVGIAALLGSYLTITSTMTVEANIEYSTDGGITWLPAEDATLVFAETCNPGSSFSEDIMFRNAGSEAWYLAFAVTGDEEGVTAEMRDGGTSLLEYELAAGAEVTLTWYIAFEDMCTSGVYVLSCDITGYVAP
jgi:hypothetical protein